MEYKYVNESLALIESIVANPTVTKFKSSIFSAGALDVDSQIAFITALFNGVQSRPEDSTLQLTIHYYSRPENCSYFAFVVKELIENMVRSGKHPRFKVSIRQANCREVYFHQVVESSQGQLLYK
jgi:hypothetical protein